MVLGGSKMKKNTLITLLIVSLILLIVVSITLILTYNKTNFSLNDDNEEQIGMMGQIIVE